MRSRSSEQLLIKPDCFLQVITKLLYLLHQGETFTKVRATCLLGGGVAIKHAALCLVSISYSQ